MARFELEDGIFDVDIDGKRVIRKGGLLFRCGDGDTDRAALAALFISTAAEGDVGTSGRGFDIRNGLTGSLSSYFDVLERRV